MAETIAQIQEAKAQQQRLEEIARLTEKTGAAEALRAIAERYQKNAADYGDEKDPAPQVMRKIAKLLTICSWHVDEVIACKGRCWPPIGCETW